MQMSERQPSNGLLNDLVVGSLRAKYQTRDIDPKSLIAFRPQERQKKLIWAAGLLDWWNGKGMAARQAPVARNIGYGGAAYGGKTYGIIGLAAMCAHAFPGCQMAFFRRTYSEMEGPGAVMGTAFEIFNGAGGKVRDGGRHWYWENGSAFYFRHCEHEYDVYKYQSQQIDILFTDEATHFTWDIIDYMLTRNRATCDSIISPFAVMPSNPGNIGHAWYMKLFDLEKDTTGVPGMARWQDAKEAKDVINPNSRKTSVFFIPAYLEDNPIGLERDPGYEGILEERNPDTYQALRFGNWDVFTGQAFREFNRDLHVIPPFDLYDEKVRRWPKWRAIDKGWYHPFFALWLMRDPATGRVYVYREEYGSAISDMEQAQYIALATPASEHIVLSFATPDFWVAKNMHGIIKTSAQEFAENGIPVIRGNPDRQLGKRMVHSLLGDGPDGKPRLQIFSNCAKLIEILPKLSVDPQNRNDVKKMDGDDPYDTLKLGLTNIDIFKTEQDRHDPKDEYQRDEWDQLTRSKVI